MRLFFLLVRRVPPVPSPVLVDVFALLRNRGFEVNSVIPEDLVTRPDRLRIEHDLYILKSHTELALSLAGVLETQGAKLLNPYASCITTQDKIVASRRLRAAGVPAPRTWVTGDLALMRPIVEETPLILKPHRGHRGAGISVVRNASELAALPPPDGLMVIQEHVSGSGEDVKVYVIGEDVFAVRKEFSPTSFTRPGRPSAVSDQLREIALRCGRTLGLGLYGLDVLETDSGPVVVDVNYFPGYKGVPEPAPLIADYIEDYAEGRRTLELPPMEAPTRPASTPREVAVPASRQRDAAEPAGRQRDVAEPASRQRVDPALVAIVAEGFFSRLSFGLLSFALPLYAYQRFGLSLTEVGFLLSFNLVIAIALKPVMGSVADRVGIKPSFTAAIGIRSVISLLLAFATVPWQLFAIRGVHGLSIAIRDPAAHVLLAEVGGKRAVASAFAWYQTAKSIAGTIGKASAGVLLTLTASNFTLVFLIAFALSALPILVVALFVREPEAAPATAVDPDSTPAAAPAVLPFAGLGFLISGTAYMLASLFPIFAVEYAGLNEAQTGLIYLVSIAAILTGPLFGWLSDNVSRRLVLSLRGAANVLSSVVYLVAPNFAGVAVGRAVDDLGKAAFRPAWGALMAHVAGFDRRRRARTMGSLSAGEDAGEVAGPILAGFLWSTWGVPVLLGVRIALAVATEIYAVVLGHSLRRRSPPESVPRTTSDPPRRPALPGARLVPRRRAP